MIKRMTKATSLLVCAASIVSIIPAYATDVKKYDAQEVLFIMQKQRVQVSILMEK